MDIKEKEIIKEQIEALKNLLESLKDLDKNNPRVQEQSNLIKNQIVDYNLELVEINKYIPLKTRLVNEFFKSKIVILNLALIIFELLNIFTDVFKESDNKYLKLIGIIIPSIVIYLRTYKK
jgi:hypothetical protein